MSANSQDNSQWLSVTEATLFLHDGLIHVTDLIVLPHDVNTPYTVHEVDHEVITFDSKSPSELSQRLKTVCGTQNNAYSRLLLLLYGYYQSRFGLIPRSRGGRWGLIKATVCSNILQMFVRY